MILAQTWPKNSSNTSLINFMPCQNSSSFLDKPHYSLAVTILSFLSLPRISFLIFSSFFIAQVYSLLCEVFSLFSKIQTLGLHPFISLRSLLAPDTAIANLCIIFQFCVPLSRQIGTFTKKKKVPCLLFQHLFQYIIHNKP